MKRSLLAVLLVLPLLGSDSRKDYDDRATKDDLEGTWQLVEHYHAQRGFKMGVGNGGTLTFRNKTFVYDHDYEYRLRGTYRINLTGYQHQLDFLDADGRTMKRIYQRIGSTLQIALTGDRLERPRSFDDDVYVFVYKRVR